MRVLLTAPYMLRSVDRFREVFEQAGVELVVAPVKERLAADELRRYAGEIDGTICGDDEFTREVQIAFSPRLKVISKWGTGIDSIDVEAAEELGIQVRNTPGAFTESVSDSVMGYLLAFARQIPWLDDDMKRGAWKKRKAVALHERSLGVIGVGRIGKVVLRKAHAFGMELYGNDILEIDPSFLDQVPVSMVPLGELLSASDFVSVNCDLNPTSHRLLAGEEFELIRQGAILVNTARGAVIEQRALIQALQDGRLGGAGLDVFEDEPLPEDSPLRAMDNVLLAPHNANASQMAWERVNWITIRNLFQGLGLEAPPEPDLGRG